METQTHTIGYIKGGTINDKQVYWFESDVAGKIYILDNKKLFNLGFYDKNWKTKDIKVVGTVHSDYQLEIDEIL